MFKIRPQQLEAIQAERDRTFAAEIAGELRRRNVAAALSCDPPSLTDRALAGIGVARRLGFTRREAIHVFVNLLFEIHPGYHAHPEAAAILSSATSSEEERIRKLLDWIGGASWIHSSDRFGPPPWP